MFEGITLIILSIIALIPFILLKKPDAQQLLDKVGIDQGPIGLFFCVYGLFGIIYSGIFHIGWLSVWPVYWITILAGNLVKTVLGFMLGFGLISKYALSKNEAAKEKGDKFLAALAPKQDLLGFIGIGVGLWTILTRIVFLR